MWDKIRKNIAIVNQDIYLNQNVTWCEFCCDTAYIISVHVKAKTKDVKGRLGVLQDSTEIIRAASLQKS